MASSALCVVAARNFAQAVSNRAPTGGPIFFGAPVMPGCPASARSVVSRRGGMPERSPGHYQRRLARCAFALWSSKALRGADRRRCASPFAPGRSSSPCSGHTVLARFIAPSPLQAPKSFVSFATAPIPGPALSTSAQQPTLSESALRPGRRLGPRRGGLGSVVSTAAESSWVRCRAAYPAVNPPRFGAQSVVRRRSPHVREPFAPAALQIPGPIHSSFAFARSEKLREFCDGTDTCAGA